VEVPLTEDRLTSTDKRALILWILLGLLGISFAHRYFFRAFPEASVDFKVSRSVAKERAQQFVQGLGQDLTGYQSTITFEVDDSAKTYLERELGLQKANQLMSKDLDIWYWEVRFFKPLQEEEFRVRINPAGRVVAYERKIEEARPLKSLNREEALATATAYLQSKLGVELDNWKFLPEEANSETRPNRVDWSFTWERENFKAKDAPYRLAVALNGNQIANSLTFLQVPEAWTRDYEHLRSTNLFYSQIALIPYGFLLGGALWLGISLTRQGKTSWGPALKIGGLVAVLAFFMEVNQWQTVRAGYDTHQAYAGFVAQSLARILLGALAAGLMVTLVLPGGEPLYRESQPDKMRLYKAFTWRGLRSKEFFSSSVVGLSLAAAHIGFIVAFYMIGSKFGVWAPQDLNYSDAVNTSFPWIAGVAIGVMAATSEEFLFRLFAIPFLRKITGSRILSIILSAFSWGFLHSNYPQEPGYIRGLEVGLIGIIAGIVMLRWGIVATLIWHYTVDASLVGLLLIRSDNLYFKVSGIVVGLAAVAPMVFSGISYLFRGCFENVDDLLNRAEPMQTIDVGRQTITQEAAPLSKRRYNAISAGALGFLAVCVIAGSLAAWKFKQPRIGDYLRVSVDARGAIKAADAAMQQRGLNPNSFLHAAQMVDTTNPITNEFLRRRMSIAEINKIYEQRIPGMLWRVRYFRDSEPEEFAITLKPDGSLHAFRHTMAEAAKGPTITKEEAIAVAEKYLRDQKRIDFGSWRLVESNSEKKPNRTDHLLTWQQIDPLDPTIEQTQKPADHAYARMDLNILGDEPANYRTYIKIPEDFARKQEEQSQSVVRILFMVAEVAIGLALVVAVFVYFFKPLRTEPARVPWRRLILWGLTGLVAFVVFFLLGKGLPAILLQYSTAIKLRLFLASTAVGIFIIGGVVLGGIALLFGLAWTFAARAFGQEQIPVWLGMPGNYYRDAFWIGLGGSALLIGLRRVIGAVLAHWPTLHQSYPSQFGDSFDAVYPAAKVIGGTILLALFLTGLIALISSFLGAELRVRWLRLLLFLALAASFVASWGSPANFLQQFVAAMVVLLVIVLGIQRIARFNMLGWFLVIASTGLLSGAIELLSQPNSFYRVQGYIVTAALAFLLLWPLINWRLKPTLEGPLAS
jgi:membrane protease YdiL (CAAX protease family)